MQQNISNTMNTVLINELGIEKGGVSWKKYLSMYFDFAFV